MTAQIYEMKAELFKALAHPVRIRTLELLSLRPHNVGELLDEIDVSGPHLSQQLAVLRQLGIVSVSRDGANRVYEIAQPTVIDLLRAAKKHLLLQLAASAESSADLERLRYGAGR